MVSSKEEVLKSVKSVENYIQEELNIDQIHYTADFEKYLVLQSQPNHKALGARLKKQYNNGEPLYYRS